MPETSRAFLYLSWSKTQWNFGSSSLFVKSTKGNKPRVQTNWLSYTVKSYRTLIWWYYYSQIYICTLKYKMVNPITQHRQTKAERQIQLIKRIGWQVNKKIFHRKLYLNNNNVIISSHGWVSGGRTLSLRLHGIHFWISINHCLLLDTAQSLVLAYKTVYSALSDAVLNKLYCYNTEKPIETASRGFLAEDWQWNRPQRLTSIFWGYFVLW